METEQQLEQTEAAIGASVVDRRVSPLPCPFCGSEVKMETHEDRRPNFFKEGYWVEHVYASIRCDGWSCVRPMAYVRKEPEDYSGVEEAKSAAESEALTMWNKRANLKVTGAPRTDDGEGNAD